MTNIIFAEAMMMTSFFINYKNRIGRETFPYYETNNYKYLKICKLQITTKGPDKADLFIISFVFRLLIESGS